jgi:hypothetical protein
VITPERRHRFEGDSGVDIATYTVDAVFPDGRKVPVVLRLGAPFLREKQWWIRTELENLDSTVGPICGADPFHALVLGMTWMTLRLERFEKEHGCRYYFTGTQHVFEHRKHLTYEEKR